MRQYSDSEYTRGMIQGLIKIQEDILKNPDLSIEQKDDIRKLRQQLDTLSLQTDDSKLKLELIDIMNRLD
jgi:hypothetical protein